jgi:hypothetical protein
MGKRITHNEVVCIWGLRRAKNNSLTIISDIQKNTTDYRTIEISDAWKRLQQF